MSGHSERRRMFLRSLPRLPMRDIRQTGGNLPMNAGVRMKSASSVSWMRLKPLNASSIVPAIDIGVPPHADPAVFILPERVA